MKEPKVNKDDLTVKSSLDMSFATSSRIETLSQNTDTFQLS